MFHRSAVPSNFGITFDRQWSHAFYSCPVALVGEQLRHAREALDYSIPDVVGMTNLMTDQVLAHGVAVKRGEKFGLQITEIEDPRDMIRALGR